MIILGCSFGGLTMLTSPSMGLSVGASVCVFPLLAAIAAVVAWVKGILPPTVCSLGVLLAPAFGGGFDMAVICQLSSCDFERRVSRVCV